MADYHVNPLWGGPFNGTLAQPYASYSSVPSLVAGDNVYFARGTTHVGRVLYNSARGASTTLGAPITFGAYGSGALPRILAGGGEYAVDIDARNGVIVQDLQLGATGSVCAGGVRVLNAGQSIVRRNTMEQRCDYGVRIDNTTSGMFSTISVLDNTILGTWSNSGILVIWGSSAGGIFEDVIVRGNSISNTGVFDFGPPTNSPYGIRMIPRTNPVTGSSGTVDLALFSLGVQVIGNTITNSRAGGLWTSSISTGGTSTLVNRVSQNKLTNVGDGVYDSHVLWAGGCRDMFIEGNEIDGSIMAQGTASGTGIGIFIDNTNFLNFFDGCRRMYVRGNKVKNTGQRPDGTLNEQLEIAGAGIFVYYSQNVEVTNNETDGCYNGIGVYGWSGTGLKAENVVVRGNRVLNSVRTGIATIAAPNIVTLQENYVDGYGVSGIYVENSGAGAATSYTETRNNVVGVAATAYHAGSEPTSSTTPAAQRTPAAGNIVLPAQWF